MSDAVLLFFANKQDLPNALTVQQISDRLGLRHTCKSRHWHIQGSSAVTGEGLYEGFLWAVDTLKAIENGKKVKSKRTGDDIVIIQDRQKKKETMHQRKFQAKLQYEKEYPLFLTPKFLIDSVSLCISKIWDTACFFFLMQFSSLP